MELGGPGNIPATNQPADAITSVYVDYSFPLNLYQITAMTAVTSGRMRAWIVRKAS